MNNRVITSSWRIVCLGMLIVGLLFVSNVPNAHASTYRNAISNSEHTTSDNCTTNPQVVGTSPVSGIDATAGTWVKVGEVALMWSSVCGTNWTVFDRTVSNINMGTTFATEDVYLYSQGGGSLHVSCNLTQVECVTPTLALSNILAQAVATATMSNTLDAFGGVKQWQAYGSSSQF